MGVASKEEALAAAGQTNGFPHPSSKSGLVAHLLDLLEKAIVWAFHRPASKPLHYLQGNYAPVAESDPCSDLPVIGYLPSCLNGEFVRIGPNPKFKPVAGYHWFDGDGMVHGLRIKDGKATYVSRFVRTSKLKQEEFFGASKFLKVGDLKGIFGVLIGQVFSLRCKLKVLDISQGYGTGNTAMVYHDGKLF